MPRIFVGNLPFDTHETELQNRFEAFGRVSSVRLATDAANHPRGFGFVVMPSLDDADEAIHQLAGTLMGGRRLTVNTAIEKQRSAEQDLPSQEHSNAMAFFDALMSD